MFEVNVNNNETIIDEDLNNIIKGIKIDYNQFYRGIVVDNHDPENKGRIKVRIPQIYGIDQSTDTFISTSDIPWATCAISSAGNDSGTFLPPNIGDTVFVTFESGQFQFPIYFGGIYTKRDEDDNEEDETKGIGSYNEFNNEIVEVNKDDLPAEVVNGTERILYKSLKGAIIYVDDRDGEECIKITDQSGQSIIMENLNKSILRRRGSNLGKNPKSQIVLTNSSGDSITLSEGKIHLKSANIIMETDNFEQIGSSDLDDEINLADIILGREEEKQSTATFSFINMRTGDPLTGVSNKVYRIVDGERILVLDEIAETSTLDVILPIGNYVISSTLDDYYDSNVEFIMEEDLHKDIQIFMTMETTEDNIQIVLTWNGRISDIDSHTKIYNSSYSQLGHVFYSNKNYYQDGINVVNLDVDDTSYYGPETTTINKSFRNRYLFYAYNYSGGNIIDAQCNVKIFDRGRLLYDLNSPETGTGRYWNIIEYNCIDKTFRLIDVITNSEPTLTGGN